MNELRHLNISLLMRAARGSYPPRAEIVSQVCTFRDKGIHVLDIRFFCKNGVVVFYYLFCFFCAIFQQAVSGKSKDFCGDYISQFIVHNVKVYGVKSAYFSTGVEGENRLDVLDVTNVGGAAAVGGSILFYYFVVFFAGLGGNLGGGQDFLISLGT